jgi:hypothetical protein
MINHKNIEGVIFIIMLLGGIYVVLGCWITGDVPYFMQQNPDGPYNCGLDC